MLRRRSGSIAADEPYAGGAVLELAYRIVLAAAPEEVWHPLAKIGGDTGWYFGTRLWMLRVRHRDWLDDYALFVVIKNLNEGKIWNEWAEAFRDRDVKSLKQTKNDCRDEVECAQFLQYLFFKQWLSLKTYCNERGIRIIGDIPIYVNFDSADVWMNSGIFKLDKEKKPLCAAGVPPDYFSATGQLWGNPVYRWEVLAKTKFKWWLQRIAHNLTLIDVLRIDHFRGFVAFWEVPAHEKTAVNAKWVAAPATDFFNALINTIRKGRGVSGGILYYQIMNGITGTAMPYFKRELESEKIWDVGNYVAVYYIDQSDAGKKQSGIPASYEH